MCKYFAPRGYWNDKFGVRHFLRRISDRYLLNIHRYLLRLSCAAEDYASSVDVLTLNDQLFMEELEAKLDEVKAEIDRRKNELTLSGSYDMLAI